MNPDSTLQQRQNRPLVRLDRGNPQHRIPAAFNLQPVHLGQPANPRSSTAEIGRHPLPDLLLNAARPSSQAGSAHCTGAFMERKVSAITSSRSIACCLPGPVATIHDAFICGNPAILLSPLTTKTGTPSKPCGESSDRQLRDPVVQKDLVHDEREVELPAQPRQFLAPPMAW